MVDTVNVNVPLDCNTKDQAETFFGALGFTLPVALNAILRNILQNPNHALVSELSLGEQGLALFDDMRVEVAARGGQMTDDEINVLIAKSRAERKNRG